ncbi:MAG: dihydropteroate synthase [Bacteroidales bacterium]|nr:dihydropteroate synthase [Bacteroidales bacterium]
MKQFSAFSCHCRSGVKTFEMPAIMGILNATPDSFYDGGKYTTQAAVLDQARKLLAEGADIIDLGVVSSRPGAQLLPPQEEAARLAPLVSLLRSELPKDTIISVDTCYSLPAAKAVEAGADIINDISGGQFDDQMFSTVASLNVPYILMHTRGLPSHMQQKQNTHYDDIAEELKRYFAEKIEALEGLGVKEIWIDPGFGFAKTLEQNHELLHRLHEIIDYLPQYPLLTALSNKSMITRQLEKYPSPALLPLPDSEIGTVALNTIALMEGSSLLRVHNPRLSQIAIQLMQVNKA